MFINHAIKSGWSWYQKFVVVTIILFFKLHDCTSEMDINQRDNLNVPEQQADGLIVKYTKEYYQTSYGSEEYDVPVRNLNQTFGSDLTVVQSLATHAQVYNASWGLKPTYKDLVAMAEFLRQDPRVEYVEPNLIMWPALVPNDTHYSDQWHYFEDIGGLRLPEAWDKANGQGVVVAVIDTGITNHSDLNENILPGYDFISNPDKARDGDGRDDNPLDEGTWTTANECGYPAEAKDSIWHGTHVAGTIAAVTNNNKGVAGVAYQAKVVPIRVLGKCGGSMADIADAIIWASGGSVPGVPDNQNPAQVINLSLSGMSPCSNTSHNAISIARANGSTVVAAAGNFGMDAATSDPASCAGAIAVAATDRQGNRASYSNYGPVVKVAAPGGEGFGPDGVLSTLNSGATTPATENYEAYEGTSMATPHVAGVAALLYQIKPDITPDEVEMVLKESTRSFPGSCSQCGTGIVDANAAIDYIENGPPPPPPAEELKNGQAVTISIDKGVWKQYLINLPAETSNLTIKLSGGSGNGDLYTRFGAPPTTNTFDCRPYKSGNDESCTVKSPQAGKYYVSIFAYLAISSAKLVASFDTIGQVTQYNMNIDIIGQGLVSLNPVGDRHNKGTTVTLTANPASGWMFSNWNVDLSGSTNPVTITMDSDKNITAVFIEQTIGSITELNNGQAIDISGNQDEWTHFYIDLPADASNLVIKISGGSGDADLHTRFGSQPTSSSYDCRPYRGGNDEQCTVSNPQAGRYYVSLHGYKEYSNTSLVAWFDTGNSE